MHGNAKSPGIAHGFQQALQTLTGGGTVSEALQISGLFSEFEIDFLSAGERSGRLAVFFYWLASYYQKQQQHLQTVLFCLLYPLFLLHVLVLLAVILLVVTSSYTSQQLINLLLVLLGSDGALALLFFTGKALSAWFPSILSGTYRMLLAIPLLGRFLFRYEVAKSVSVFQGLYGSGLPLAKSWQYLPDLTMHPELRVVFKRVHDRLVKRETLAKATTYEDLLPKHLRNFIAVGESSLQLDRILLKAKDILEREADMAMRLFLFVATVPFILATLGFGLYQLIMLVSMS